MRAITIRDAKARLNELVEAAVQGEQVVLMRGSKHVATIVRISAEDLELSPRLTDAQAERLWRELAVARAAGSTLIFERPEAAVARLAAGIRPHSRRRSKSPRKRTARPSR